MREKTEELDRYYEEQFAMVNSKGWTDFMADLQRVKDSLIEGMLNTSMSEAGYQFARGQIRNIDYILSWKETLEAADRG